MAPPPPQHPPATPLLPGVHSYLIKQEPSLYNHPMMAAQHHHQQQQPSLPSLPSLLGSLSGRHQYMHQQQSRQQQSLPVSFQSQQQQQSQAPAPVSISSLLNPTMQRDARATTQFRMLPPLTTPAPVAQAPVSLVRVRSRPAEFTTPAAAASQSPMSNNGSESGMDEQTTQPGAQPKKKRRARICKADGCEKYVVDRGLCIRHGGGKRCSVEECNCRAQNRGLCWKHGGYTRCTVDGCTKRAKSRGICWSHGGGTRCKHASCSKIAVSHGLCWAHGGGKRCLVESCQKPAYERNGNLCAEHCSAPAGEVPAFEER